MVEFLLENAEAKSYLIRRLKEANGVAVRLKSEIGRFDDEIDKYYNILDR